MDNKRNASNILKSQINTFADIKNSSLNDSETLMNGIPSMKINFDIQNLEKGESVI